MCVPLVAFPYAHPIHVYKSTASISIAFLFCISFTHIHNYICFSVCLIWFDVFSASVFSSGEYSISLFWVAFCFGALYIYRSRGCAYRSFLHLFANRTQFLCSVIIALVGVNCCWLLLFRIAGLVSAEMSRKFFSILYSSLYLIWQPFSHRVISFAYILFVSIL